MSLEKKVSGQSFEIFAREWNDIADTVKFVEDRQQNSGGENNLNPIKTGEVWVENKSAGALNQGAIVALQDLSIIPTNATEQLEFLANIPALEAKKFSQITAADIWKTPLAILKNGLDTDEIGKAFFWGIVPTLVDVTDEDHIFCRPIETTLNELTSDFSGPCRILWKASGTGTKEAVVLLQDLNWINGKPENPYVINRGSSADDNKEWNPLADPPKPESWRDYDGVRLVTRVLRYTSGVGAKLEYIDYNQEWLTRNAPIISKATVTLATTSTC